MAIEQQTQTITDERQQGPTLVDPESGPLPDTIKHAPRAQVVRDEQQTSLDAPGGPVAILSHSNSLAGLFAAFAKAQGEYGAVEKSLTAKVASRKGEGSSYSYDYETLADVLAAVREPNARNGLAVMQFPVRKGRVLLVRTMLTHSSGEWMTSDLTVEIFGTDPQSLGSGISYVRRYALKSILGLAATDEDDDGQRASEDRQPKTRDAERPLPSAAPRKSSSPTSTLTPTVGTVIVVALVDAKSGAVLVELDTDFKCTTRNPQLAKMAAEAKTAATPVTLLTRPSSDPSRFYPILEQITHGDRE